VSDHDHETEPLDAVDQAFIASLVPEGAAMVQFVTILSWMTPEGQLNWKTYNRTDEMPVSMVIGLLELAKLELIARSDCGIPLSYPSDD